MEKTQAAGVNSTSANTTPVKKLLLILAFGVVTGVVYDYFFYQKLPGIAFPLFMLIIVGGITAVTLGFKRKQERHNLWLIIPTVFFAVMVAVRANPALTLFNMVLSFFCLFLLIGGLDGKKTTSFLYKDYISSFLVVPLRFFEKGFEFLGEFIHIKRILPGNKILNQVIKGVLLAIPVLIIFIALFSSADAVFNQMVKNIFHANPDPEGFFRTVSILVVSFVACGLFYFTQNSQRGTVNIHSENTEIDSPKRNFSAIEMSIFLGLINALFLLFILIQFTYLFGGQQNISIEGFTYAEYARRGFFELVCVSIISYFIMVTCEKNVEKKAEDHTHAFKIFGSILTVQVLIIMAAAFMRMALYEEAYGMSQLRFMSHTFIIYLGIIFSLFLIKIFTKQHASYYVFEAFITGLVFIGVINILNPDAFIVRQNIARMNHAGTVDFDYYYLRSLSEDAVPEILLLLQSKDSSIQYEAQLILEDFKENRHENSTKYDAWQSWNLSRYRATDLLKQVP